MSVGEVVNESQVSIRLNCCNDVSVGVGHVVLNTE